MEQALQLLARLQAGGIGLLPELLTRNFVLRTEDGITLGSAIEAEAPTPECDRLRHALLAGRPEDAGDGYVLIGPPADVDAANADAETGFWVLRLQGGRLAVAFEFAQRAEAIAAIPARLQPRTNVELVNDAIWAFVHRDVSKLLTTIADDFAYTDLHFGRSLEGGSKAVTQLLLAHPDLADRGLQGLELREVEDGVVEATGVLTRDEPGGSVTQWRWRTSTGIVDGHAAWTVREPDEPIDA
jgi:hypothetical protein